MYARVFISHVHPHPARQDEAIQIHRDSTLPSAKELAGYKGGLLLLDRTSGKAIWITLWETEADLKASEASGHVREGLANVAHLLAGPPFQETYEVVVDDIQPSSATMYARVAFAEAHLDKHDEVIQTYRDYALPAARQLKGYKGGLLLVNRSTAPGSLPKGISITLWETEADLKASEASGHVREQYARVAHQMTTPLAREHFEVTLQDWA